MKKLIHVSIAFLLSTAAAMALVVTPPTTPSILQGGYTPTASDWNTAIVGAYTYVNENIVTALNTITTKGDLYVYNGTNLARQGVGANAEVLIARAAQATGMTWGTTTGFQPVTTKGDLEVCDGSTINRLPVGTDGYALVARPSNSNGMAWESLANSQSYPAGSIIAWSPSFAATGTPSGWAVCDGTSGHPNLIGRFVLGTRPNGSAASPSAGGFGAQNVDANGSGAVAHTVTFTLNVTDGSGGSQKTSVTSGDQDVQSGTGATVAGTHSHQLSSVVASAAGSNEKPSDYALVYLIKL